MDTWNPRSGRLVVQVGGISAPRISASRRQRRRQRRACVQQWDASGGLTLTPSHLVLVMRREELYRKLGVNLRHRDADALNVFRECTITECLVEHSFERLV